MSLCTFSYQEYNRMHAEIAEEIASKFRAPQSTWVNIHKICEKAGITIKYIKLIDKARAYAVWTKEKNSTGFHDKPVIFLNRKLENDNPGRIRFIIAHEFMHIVLCDKEYEEYAQACYGHYDPSNPTISIKETIVNYFASYLLMPEIPFKKMFNAGDSFADIAYRFGTTIEQVARRACQGNHTFPFHLYAADKNCDVLFSYSFDDLPISNSVLNKYEWSSFSSIIKREGISRNTLESGIRYYCSTRKLHSNRYLTLGAPFKYRYAIDRLLDFPG